jgi:hypothetical protein
VPNLAGKTDMIPGRVTRMVIQADRPGVYRGQCVEYCGAQHALMAFDVIVTSRAEFGAWLAGLARPAREPEKSARRSAPIPSASVRSCRTLCIAMASLRPRRASTRDLSRDPERALTVYSRAVLGMNPEELGSPWASALSSLATFAAGALVPLVPWFIATGVSAVVGSLALAVGAALAIGGLLG